MCERKNPRVEKQVENAVSKLSLTRSKCRHTHRPFVQHYSTEGWVKQGSLQTVNIFISSEVTNFWTFQKLGVLPRSPLHSNYSSIPRWIDTFKTYLNRKSFIFERDLTRLLVRENFNNCKYQDCVALDIAYKEKNCVSVNFFFVHEGTHSKLSKGTPPPSLW